MHIKMQETCNAMLTMVSTQSIDNETDSSTLQSEAVYQFSEGSAVISFFETAEDQMQQHTVITFLKDKLVTINRSGICNSEFLIQIGQTHPCKYELPFGSLELSIFGKEIRSDLNEQGGELFLSYAVYTNGNIAGNNTVSVNIQLK